MSCPIPSHRGAPKRAAPGKTKCLVPLGSPISNFSRGLLDPLQQAIKWWDLQCFAPSISSRVVGWKIFLLELKTPSWTTADQSLASWPRVNSTTNFCNYGSCRQHLRSPWAKRPRSKRICWCICWCQGYVAIYGTQYCSLSSIFSIVAYHICHRQGDENKRCFTGCWRWRRVVGWV